MKPLEEYMLFTKTGAEKVNVSNSQGVRSAQCSPHFDVLHKIPAGPTNLNISQVKKIIREFRNIPLMYFLVLRVKIKLGLKTLLKESYTLQFMQRLQKKKITLGI